MITALIVVHEFGHFFAAKYYGFQTPVFGIGLPFGPSIDLGKKWDTQFKFYWALIGGFVAIPELGDETDPETIKEYKIDKPLREFPVHQRAVVASGGIVFNILFAFLLAIIMAATIGLPVAKANNTITAFIDDSSVAEKAGLKIGDQIIQVNSMQISTGTELQTAIKNFSHQDINVKIKRASNPKSKNHQIISTKFYSQGSLGVMLGNNKEYQKYPFNPLTWIIEAFKFTLNTMIGMFISIIAIFGSLFTKIASIFNPNIAPAAVELGEVKGIVGIVQIISQDIKSNALLLLEFAILLSLNLAVINVLPIPALDGGHLVFMAYEAIAGKKPSEKILNAAMQTGFVFLLSIIALTTLNDVKNWIWH